MEEGEKECVVKKQHHRMWANGGGEGRKTSPQRKHDSKTSI